MSLEKIVAFDADDVLFPLRKVLVDEFNRRFGTSLSIDGYNCFSFSGWLARDHPEEHKVLMQNGGKFGFFRYVSEQGLLINTPPYEGVVESLREISDSGKKIAIVSYRGTFQEPDIFYVNGPEETIEWLVKFKIPFDYIRFTDKKAAALSDLERRHNGKILLFVEDHPANIIPAVNSGFNVAIMDKPYNKKTLVDETDDATDYGRGTYTQADWDKILEVAYRANSIFDIKWILPIQERINAQAAL